MADTVYKDATGGQIRYEDVVTDLATNRRIPKSVPTNASGTPLFGSDNPGHVVVDAGSITFPPEVEIKNTDGAPIPTTDAGLGADGTSPPAIAGTGVRGWLRGIYERLTGTLAISATSLPLPTGAASASAQVTGNTSLASIDAKAPALVLGRTPVDGSGVTQPVSAAALPLPAGAATAAAQGSGNTSLSSIDTKTPPLSSGRVPVDGSAVTQPISAAALPLPSGAATAIRQDTGNTSLASMDGKLPALSAGRIPVDGSAVTQPISATALPLPTGASTSANQATANGTLASILLALGLVLTRRAGTTGADFSVNPPTVTGTVLATIPANPNRNYAEVQNLSTSSMQVVRDDGTGPVQTVMVLNPAPAVGMGGGSWSTDTFKGRVRVYGTAGSSVTAFED